ncbi:histone-like nucleoid-structuring protein Lsr2 [Streptomyces adustus]|uniref:Lsr2 family DNA-binding protein n=2 Tax=Streptomyces adustus TaxID=1609272 RepID=UPI0035D8D752
MTPRHAWVCDCRRSCGSCSMRTPAAARELGPDDEAMRLWARANGFHVNNAGRIPSAIREAYRLATQGVVDAGQTPGNG